MFWFRIKSTHFQNITFASEIHTSADCVHTYHPFQFSQRGITKSEKVNVLQKDETKGQREYQQTNGGGKDASVSLCAFPEPDVSSPTFLCGVSTEVTHRFIERGNKHVETQQGKPHMKCSATQMSDYSGTFPLR